MATLGDYIHYYWKNYEKYGITQKGGGNINFNIIQSQKDALIAKIKSKKRQSGLEKLQQTLNDLIYPTIQESDPSANIRMQNYLKATIGDMLTKWAIQWEGLGINGGPVDSGFKFGEKLGYKISSINSLIERANSIKTQLLNNPDQTRLINQLDQILQLANQAKNISSSYLKKWGSSGDNMIQYDMMDTKSKNKYQGIIRQLNDALTQVSAATYSQAIGTSFEYAIGTLDDRLNDTVDNISTNLLKNEIVTGNKIDNITFSGIDTHMKNLSSSFKRSFEDSTVNIKTSGKGEVTQGVVFKTDVNLLYGGETYKISAKNYSLKYNKNIHMVQNTPLLNVLMKNTSNEFINHAFNIIFSNDGDSRQRNYSSQTHRAIKTILILEAISGLSQKAGAADTLVINSRSEKKIKVFSMADLITPEQLIDTRFKISGYKLDKDITNYNKWQGEGRDWLNSKKRIDLLLTKLHSDKIQVSLNSSKI